MSLKLNTTVSLENPGINAIQDVSIDNLSAEQEVSVNRNIHAKSSLDPIPMATENKLGGIKAATKDNTYTDEVKINTSNGKLYTKKIADKVSDLENDSNFQTDIQVEETVNEEAVLRANADDILQINITSESTRATTAEQNLSQLISTETSNRTSSDNILQANINAEASARQTADNAKLDKVSTANKIYGTDTNGAQTTYDKDNFGQIDDIKFKGNSIVTNKVGIIPKDLSSYDNDSNFQNETQVNTKVSTHNSSNQSHSDIRQLITNEANTRSNADISLGNRTSAIESLIPEQASSTNQLGDKAFINSSIENMAAFRVKKRIGSGTQEDPYQYVSFNTKAELNSITTVYIDGIAKTPGKNDFAIVLADESKKGTAAQAPTARYSYPKSNTEPYDPSAWEFDYIVNNTGLTAVQMAAIDSGITSTLVENINLNTAVRHSHSNKSILDEITNDNLVTSNEKTTWNNKPSINSTNYYVPYRSSSNTFANSTLMYNSNAMAFTGKLHIGSLNPVNYYDKGRLTIYDNTAETQTTSLALLNYGGGGGCGVSIDMYNTSANGGIPSGKIGVIDNGNYSAYLQIGCKKSGSQYNPVVSICTMTPLPYSGAGYTTFNVGRSYYDNSIFDIYTSGAWEYVNDGEQRWTGSGTIYTVGSQRLKPEETYAVGDMISLSSDGSNAVSITSITYNSTYLRITTDATLGSLSNRYVYIRKGLMRVHSATNTYFFVNPFGKTGIGISNPQYDLDVNGIINASADIKKNGVSVACIDDNSTTSTTETWSANKLNTTIGNIETLLEALL